MNSMVIEEDFKEIQLDLVKVKDQICIEIPDMIVYHYDVIKGVRTKKYHPNEIDFSYKLMKCTIRSLNHAIRCLAYDIVLIAFDCFAFLIGLVYWLTTMRPGYMIFGSEPIHWVQVLRHELCVCLASIAFANRNNAKETECPRCKTQMKDVDLVYLTGWCFECSRAEFEPKNR